MCPDGSQQSSDGTCGADRAANNNNPAPEQTPAAEVARVQQSYRCVGWRQTHACDPNGRRDRTRDLGCVAPVPAGASGFCECTGVTDGQPHRVRLSTCDHLPFTCADECARADLYSCDGWRQTGECSADGPREEALDRTCADTISRGLSGFCECGGGARRVPRPPGCESADVTAESCETVCSRGESLYAALGLPDGAPDSSLKQAFRRLSLKLHPDKQRTEATRAAASRRFAEVRAAYDLLSDPDARILYDMHGCEAAADKANRQREPSVEVKQEVSLLDAYLGGERSVSISRRVVCKGCSAGAGGGARTRCQRCTDCPNEVKNVQVQLAPGFVVQQPQEVKSEERCEQQQYKLDFAVRKGMADGEQVTFARAGEQRPGRIPGDVKLTVKVGSEAEVEVVSRSSLQTTKTKMKRKGKDLHVNVELSLREALLGFNISLTHIDGHKVAIVRTAGAVTAPGVALRVPGEGMPHSDADGVVDAQKTGALVLHMSVGFPARLSDEAAEWAGRVLPP